MKNQVECPICEHRFVLTVKQSAKQTTNCLLCHREFEIGSNRIEETVDSLTQTNPTPPVKTNQQQPKRPTKPTTQSAPVNPQTTSQQPQPEQMPVAKIWDSSSGTTQSNFEVARSTKARAMLKRRKSPMVPIILGIAMIVSAVALVVVLVNVNQGNKSEEVAKNSGQADAEAKSEENNESENPDANDTTSEIANEEKGERATIFRTEGQSDEVLEPPVNAPPDQPPKKNSYRYFSADQSGRFWEKTYQHIVRLCVTTPDGRHYVSGAIVDSRGWVVTSLSGVSNASKIEVQRAAADLKEFNGIQLASSDQVRSVIATDPENDLVLLSINLALVVSFSSLEIGETESLVGGKYLIQCACPGTDNYAWPNEVQLDRRVVFDDLDFDFQSQIEERKFTQEVDYLVHTGYRSTAVGAPIFTIEGELVGVNSGITDKSRKVIVAPAEAIKILVDSSSNTGMGLSLLGSNLPNPIN